MTKKRKKMLSPFNIEQTESYRSFSKDWYLSVSVSFCGILETFQAQRGHWLLLHEKFYNPRLQKRARIKKVAWQNDHFACFPASLQRTQKNVDLEAVFHFIAKIFKKNLESVAKCCTVLAQE